MYYNIVEVLYMRLKKKNCIIALIILLLIIVEIFNPINLIATFSLKKHQYSYNSSKKILSLGLKKQALDNEYSEFVDKYVNDKHFLVDNYDVYRKLEFPKNIDDLNLINELIDKGYNYEEINCIIKTGSNDALKSFLKLDKASYVVDFLKYDYAHLYNFSRYVEYQMKTLSSYEETVLYVELDLDKDNYVDYNTINDFSYTIFVNKHNKLSSTFSPSDLVKVNTKYSVDDDTYGNKTMLANFYQMADDLNKELNLNIYVRSGYRSYDEQDKVYKQYLKDYGEKYTKANVANPGFSEHQTGLAVDIKASSSNTFANTKEAKWLVQNAYKYGFIERYPKKFEEITGCKSEIWHYRYVGKEVATYIKENNISFDEYYVKFLNK